MKKIMKIAIIIIGILFVLQGLFGLYIAYEDSIALSNAAEELGLNNTANEKELNIKYLVAFGFILIGLLMSFFGNKIGKKRS